MKATHIFAALAAAGLLSFSASAWAADAPMDHGAGAGQAMQNCCAMMKDKANMKMDCPMMKMHGAMQHQGMNMGAQMQDSMASANADHSNHGNRDAHSAQPMQNHQGMNHQNAQGHLGTQAQSNHSLEHAFNLIDGSRNK